jgi:hypothetical protein
MSKIEEMAEESASPIRTQGNLLTYRVAYVEGARDLLEEARKMRGNFGDLIRVSDLEALFEEKKETGQ